jgi:hypothetical protein
MLCVMTWAIVPPKVNSTGGSASVSLQRSSQPFARRDLVRDQIG